MDFFFSLFPCKLLWIHMDEAQHKTNIEKKHTRNPKPTTITTIATAPIQNSIETLTIFHVCMLQSACVCVFVWKRERAKPVLTLE